MFICHIIVFKWVTISSHLAAWAQPVIPTPLRVPSQHIKASLPKIQKKEICSLLVIYWSGVVDNSCVTAVLTVWASAAY
jgi:hypothetical protein